MLMRDYISTFSSSDEAATQADIRPLFKPYMRAWCFSDDHPQLEEDFPNPPPYFPDKFKGIAKTFQPPFTWIFVGPAGLSLFGSRFLTQGSGTRMSPCVFVSVRRHLFVMCVYTVLVFVSTCISSPCMPLTIYISITHFPPTPFSINHHSLA